MCISLTIGKASLKNISTMLLTLRYFLQTFLSTFKKGEENRQNIAILGYILCTSKLNSMKYVFPAYVTFNAVSNTDCRHPNKKLLHGMIWKRSICISIVWCCEWTFALMYIFACISLFARKRSKQKYFAKFFHSLNRCCTFLYKKCTRLFLKMCFKWSNDNGCLFQIRLDLFAINVYHICGYCCRMIKNSITVFTIVPTNSFLLTNIK